MLLFPDMNLDVCLDDILEPDELRPKDIVLLTKASVVQQERDSAIRKGNHLCVHLTGNHNISCREM